MQLHQLSRIELRALKNLRLPNEHILKGKDPRTRFLNLLPNRLNYQLLNQFLQIAIPSLPQHNLKHLLPNLPDLTTLSVSRLPNLTLPPLRKSDRKQPHEITVGRSNVLVGLDQGLPPPDEGSKLVRGEIHAVEVGETVFALDVIDAELDLAISLLFVFVKIGEREFEDSSFE